MDSYGYQSRCALLCRCVRLAGDLNDDDFAVNEDVGKAHGKQIREGLGLWGSKRIRNADMPYSEFTRSLEAAGSDSFRALPMPKEAASLPRPASCCLPHAPPVSQTGAGKQKTASKDRSQPLISLRKSGAGEGIRTLDPNLGKVVLYP
jgi:hypothetical protein